jgi:cytochrome P450
MKQGLSPRQCEITVSMQIVAGADTSTIAMCGTMLHLMTAPVAYQNLKAELAEGIRDGRISSPVTVEEAKTLPYLQVCVAGPLLELCESRFASCWDGRLTD